MARCATGKQSRPSFLHGAEAMPPAEAKDSTEFLLRFGCSATAASLSEFITFPIDTTKVLLQLQNEGGSVGKAEYRGMFGIAGDVVKAEGMRGFYVGSTAAVLRQFYLGGLVYGMYHPIRRAIGADQDQSLGKKVLAGGLAGGIGQFMATPTDVVKVRLQSDRRLVLSGQPARYTGMIHAARTIYATEGLQAFARGWAPNVQRSAVLNAAGIPAYDHTKASLIAKGWGDSTRTHMMASAVAGLCAVTAEMPFDLVKTRMMVQGGLYFSSWDCLTTTLRTEGVLALWAGFVPAYVRLGPWQMIFFVTYENLTKTVMGEAAI